MGLPLACAVVSPGVYLFMITWQREWEVGVAEWNWHPVVLHDFYVKDAILAVKTDGGPEVDLKFFWRIQFVDGETEGDGANLLLL